MLNLSPMILFALMLPLYGCSTATVIKKNVPPPANMTVKCEEKLKGFADGRRSTIMRTTKINDDRYKNCSARHNALVDHLSKE